MDARSVLGVSAVRPPLLVHLPAAQPREGQAGRRARRVRLAEHDAKPLAIALRLDDDFDDDLDEDDEDRDEDDDGEDDEDDQDEETETWQVSSIQHGP